MPKEPKKVQKKQKKIWPILISCVVFAGIGVTIYLNRHTIGKLVANVPVMNKIFKVAEDAYANTSKEDLLKEIETLKASIQTLEGQIADKGETESLLNDKIETLKQYEVQYSDFVSQKEAWDAEIAKSNPDLFIQQYEAMNPELAKNLYKDLIVAENMTKEQKKHANVVAEMDADQAAKALEKLVGTDPELIKVLFKAMEQERQAAILSAMQSQYAAQVIKLISP